MIDFLSNWIENLAISVIIVSIFEIILPNGNIKKYIKIVLGVYVLFTLISPFVNAQSLYDIGNINLDNYIDDLNTNSVNQTSMDARLKELYIDEIKSDLDKRIKEHGYKIYKCKVDANLDNSSKNAGIHKIELTIVKNSSQIQKVDINIANKESNNESYEDVQEIINDISSYYEIDSSIINIKVK